MSGFVWLFVWLKKVVSKVISSTTRPETEPGPSPIKAGLGDQESGLSRVDDWSKSHHPRCQNGDDWQCQNVPPSVILVGLKMKTSVRIEMIWMKPIHQKSSMLIHQLFQYIIVRYRSREDHVMYHSMEYKHDTQLGGVMSWIKW